MEATQHGPWPHWKDGTPLLPLRIEPYSRERDYPDLVTAWLGHAHEPTVPEGLPGGVGADARPGVGFIARDEQGVFLACGFVYATGTLLFVGPHYLMVNPRLRTIEGGKQVGDAALDAVVEALDRWMAEQVGPQGGAVTTWADPANVAVVARARKHGYRLIGRFPMVGKIVGKSTVKDAAQRTAQDTAKREAQA